MSSLPLFGVRFSSLEKLYFRLKKRHHLACSASLNKDINVVKKTRVCYIDEQLF